VVGLVFASVPLANAVGPDPIDPSARGFVRGLRDLGWVEGSTIVIERRSAEGEPQRAPAIFAELAASGVDVIAFTGTRSSVAAARQATQTIPLTSVLFTDPVADGQIASLARPGGNLTGLTYTTGPEFVAKRLQLLRDMVPGIARVAFLGQQEYWESLGKAVAAAELPPIFAQVDRSEQFEEAFAAILRERADALYAADSPVNYVNSSRIVAFAAQQRLPAAYGSREAVEAGGLMYYGASGSEIYRQLAGLVDKILKGAKPADIPVERPTKFELVINLKTAKALGLTIPPLLLARADEVIE
jgi:putative tryptophan/tyrosine transport system substrate-binding protein